MPFPSAIEVKNISENNQVQTFSFMTSGAQDISLVRDVIERIPPVAELQLYRDSASLKKYLNTYVLFR